MSERRTNTTLFPTPFSREYWRLSALEFKNTKTLVFAALMIALRIIFKAVRIPLGPYLNVNTAFVINALGAMSFGPVVAIAAAAVTDTLGSLIFPSGPYFFPFILVEIAGSLVFALFLYRTEITAVRVILSRFCICFFVNIVLQTPIMALYYEMILGKYYVLIDIPRIIKNMALFPVEAAVLILLLKYVVPPLKKQGLVASSTDRLTLDKRGIALLIVLTLVSVATAGGYSLYSYNHTSVSAQYTPEERLQRNSEVREEVLRQRENLDPDGTVVIIESALPRFGSAVMTYQAAVYQADRSTIDRRAQEGGADWETILGYSKSPAARDEALTLIGRIEIAFDQETKTWSVGKDIQ